MPQARFDHLLRLTGPHGLYEHAQIDRPRLEHGYCTDDNARAVVVLVRAAPLDGEMEAAFETYLSFVEAGRVKGGWHNRRHASGTWTDERGPDDAHGRALWALGVAARSAPKRGWRDRAAEAFQRGADLDTPYPRSAAFALLGATDALATEPAPAASSDLMERLRPQLPRPRPGAWRWPEARLSYANARLPEAMLATGVALDDPALVTDGLDLLAWLVEIESDDQCFSFTPVGGRGPGDRRPAFDQQPIEAWAMTDACRRAAAVTGDVAWTEWAVRAAAWFDGANDVGARLYDPATGGGCDGLTPTGVNRNQGAESTLAALGSRLAA